MRTYEDIIKDSLKIAFNSDKISYGEYCDAINFLDYLIERECDYQSLLDDINENDNSLNI